MGTRKFLDTFVPGPNMKPAQLRKVGDLSALDLDYDKIEESVIYPIVVSVISTVQMNLYGQRH